MYPVYLLVAKYAVMSTFIMYKANARARVLTGRSYKLILLHVKNVVHHVQHVQEQETIAQNVQVNSGIIIIVSINVLKTSMPMVTTSVRIVKVMQMHVK